MEAIFQIESRDGLQKVSQQVLRTLYYVAEAPQKKLDPDETYEKAKQEMRNIISESNFDIKNISKLCREKGWHVDKVNIFLELMEENWSDILKAALNHYNSTYGETVAEFDWVVKYVLGTSELKTLKYPLLQLLLSTVNKNGQQNKIMYDVNKDMLLKLINVLETV